MEFNPSQFRLLLAGPKVSRLLPFVTGRGYVADACLSGSEAIDLLREAARHVLLVELELDDMLLADLLHTVRHESLAGAVILIDDPARSGMIISELVRGVDGYVATPPDELYLFRVIERQLLAQWALAHIGSAPTDSKLRVVKSDDVEPVKARQPAVDTAPPYQEIAAPPATVPAKSAASSKKPAEPAAVEKQDDDDWFDDAVALNTAPEAPATVERKGPSTDERTPPHGVQPAARAELAQPASAQSPAPKPKEDDEDLFLDVDVDEPASQSPRAVPKPVTIPR